MCICIIFLSTLLLRITKIPKLVFFFYLKVYWKDGKICQPMPTLEGIRNRVETSLKTLRQDHKRNLNPTPYKVKSLICLEQSLFLVKTCPRIWLFQTQKHVLFLCSVPHLTMFIFFAGCCQWWTVQFHSWFVASECSYWWTFLRLAVAQMGNVIWSSKFIAVSLSFQSHMCSVSVSFK